MQSIVYTNSRKDILVKSLPNSAQEIEAGKSKYLSGVRVDIARSKSMTFGRTGLATIGGIELLAWSARPRSICIHEAWSTQTHSFAHVSILQIRSFTFIIKGDFSHNANVFWFSAHPRQDPVSSKSKFHNNLAKINRISWYARVRPMQFLGPVLNGLKASRLSWRNKEVGSSCASGSQRSGQKAVDL